MCEIEGQREREGERGTQGEIENMKKLEFGGERVYDHEEKA